MITKIYTCDRCKAADTTNEIDLIPIKIVIFNFQSEVGRAEWCRKCLNEMSLNTALPDVKRVEPTPTIEDIIREIVREERGTV